MPYANEHSARLVDPRIDHLRVRRTSDGSVQGVKVPGTVDTIWYIIKSGSQEVPVAQALRFPVKDWSEDEARGWLKENDIKYIKFEPAKKHKPMEMSRKILSMDVKDVDEKGKVSFYFSVFNNRDDDGDIVHRGAFAKTIQENLKRVKHFKNHNWNNLVGVPVEIKEDDTGALAVSQLILNTQLGKDTYEEYKAGGITEHSFGFDVVKYEINEDGEEKTRVLKELKLWEFSSLTAWGANDMTRTVDVKNRKVLEDYLSVLESLKKGDFSDDYFTRLEERISIIYKHIQSLTEPVEATRVEPIGYFLTNLKFINNG
jgi:HK97 family phage prohead protease